METRPQPTCGFHFPHQAGHVIADTRPIGGAAAERGAGGERAAVIRNFGEIEPGIACANFGELPGCGGGIAPVAAILPGVYAAVTADCGAAGNGRVRGVVAFCLAGIV
jgi:hypothetical protein